MDKVLLVDWKRNFESLEGNHILVSTSNYKKKLCEEKCEQNLILIFQRLEQKIVWNLIVVV